MRDPVTYGVEFIVISVESFRPLTGIARGSVWGAVRFLDTFWLLLRFAIYLIKNIHSYLSQVFPEAPLVEHLSHVGAMQHDLPCESVEWLLHVSGFCLEVLSKRQ